MKILGKLNNLFGKKFIAIILGIFLLILLIAGSYAAWYWDNLGESNLINAESVEIEFLESDSEVIDIENMFPVIDSVGMTQEDTFDFQVKTKTNKEVDISYALYIEKLEADSGYSFLKDEEVKVYLTDFSNNEKVAPTKISLLDDYSLYTETNSHNESSVEQVDKFKLRVWVDEDVTALDWDKDTKLQYKFKIGVRANESNESVGGEIAVTMLMSKVGQSGFEEVIHEADSTLQIGATEDITEYRFRGENSIVTNNYVYFNCDDINAQSSDTCELYRIIGVFPVDDGTGKIENRIKLIKAENYANNYFDRQSEDEGLNNWARPATINTVLNETYWSTINKKYQVLIGNAKYYLGGTSYPTVKANEMYKAERKIEGSDYYTDNFPNNWIGKIALMYPSDYGYAAISECSENVSLYSYSNTCRDYNWLYFKSIEWLISHRASYTNSAFTVFSNGSVRNNALVHSNFKVSRPVFYLNSNAEFNGIGDGSQENPYQLKAIN